MNKPHDFPDMSSMRAAASAACAMLKVLSNEDRLLILCQLINGPSNVGELEASLGIRQPTLSQQLTVLRDEGLVATRRKGKYIIYSLASPDVVSIMETLYSIYCETGESARVRDRTDEAEIACSAAEEREPALPARPGK